MSEHSVAHNTQNGNGHNGNGEPHPLLSLLAANPLAADKAGTLRAVFLTLAVAGGVGLFAGGFVFVDEGQSYNLRQVMFSYLWGFYAVLTVTLGALFWTQIFHLTAAGWSVSIRRTFEHFLPAIPVLGVLFLPVLLTMPSVYQWADMLADPGAYTKSEMTQLHKKDPYLTYWFFWVRAVGYFALWSWLGLTYYRNSVRQDTEDAPELSRQSGFMSSYGTVLLGITVTFMAFDFSMSLDYNWFSTMFGVYTWAGCIRSGMAACILMVLALRASGHLKGVVTVEHLHDMGKLSFAFTVFWAYVTFSQYFLIWYANLPEETRWFERRGLGVLGLGSEGEVTNYWQYVGKALAWGHFIIPFCFLMPRSTKRVPLTLGIAAAWILVFHCVDLYFQIMPTLWDGGPYRRSIPGSGSLYETLPGRALSDVCALLMMVGVLGTVVLYSMTRVPLTAKGDPRLEESLNFENNE